MAQQTEFFVILGHFLAFYPTNNPKKPQNFEKMNNNPLEISSFYTSVLKIMIIYYTVPEIWCVTDVVFFFNFGLFFAFLPPPPPPTDGKSDIKRWVSHLKMFPNEILCFFHKVEQQISFKSMVIL